MNTFFALVFTFSVNGEVFQTVPATFFTLEECKQVITDNKLSAESFQCEQIQE